MIFADLSRKFCGKLVIQVTSWLYFFAVFQDPEREGGGEGGDDEDGEGEGEPEDLTVYEYQPPESKPWESLGSEMEIEDHIIKHSRDLVSIQTSVFSSTHCRS